MSDEKSFALPSILANRRYRVHSLPSRARALSAWIAQCAFMPVTPNDDHSFTLFYRESLHRLRSGVFQKLAPSRKVEANGRKNPTTGASILLFGATCARKISLANQRSLLLSIGARAACDIGQRRDSTDPQDHSQCIRAGAGKRAPRGALRRRAGASRWSRSIRSPVCARRKYN